MEGAADELNDTLNTQPALFVHSLASYRAFSHLYPDLKPALLAGHSLGELSALAAAGAFSFEDGLRLVRKRAELMKRAGQLSPGGMAAILGVDIPTLDKVCTEASEWTNNAGWVLSVSLSSSAAPSIINFERAKPRMESASSKVCLATGYCAASSLPMPTTWDPCPGKMNAVFCRLSFILSPLPIKHKRVVLVTTRQLITRWLSFLF